MRDTNDFVIAEKDLVRGPVNFCQRQSGMPEFVLADLAHRDLLTI